MSNKKKPYKVQVISLFPDMFPAVFETSMLKKAKDDQVAEYEYINLRDFGIGPRKNVDDTPYGGGAGMLLKPEPLFAAVEYCKQSNPESRVILLTPRGERFTQSVAQQLATNESGLILVCGRYEGYDERITSIVDQQLSIGDFVLTGGEIPAMAVVDAVVRLLPGVLGNEDSAKYESFQDTKTLEHPHYTRPEVFRGMKVPGVLLGGNHAEIEQWRQDNSQQSS